MAKTGAGFVDITAELRSRLIKLRQGTGMTRCQLAARSLVSERTIQLIEHGDRDKCQERTILKIAKGLDISFQALVDVPRAREPIHQSTAWAFSDLKTVAQRIDGFILESLRDHRSGDPDLLVRTHADLLFARLGKQGISLGDLHRQLNEPQLVRTLAQSMPAAGLKIEVESKFRELSLSAGSASIRVDNPTLLWDCHCLTPRSTSTVADCPIHSHPEGKLITKVFSTGLVEIVWRGLRFVWYRTAPLWPPSVDSFALVNDLLDAGILQADTESVLDLGSGTGFIGTAVASLNSKVRHVTFGDWLLSPALFSAVNWIRNADRFAANSFRARIGMWTDWLPLDSDPVRTHALVICNPPYLPILKGCEDLGRQSPVVGTDLLERLISNANSLGSRVILQFSNLANLEAATAAVRGGVGLEPLGDERRVPFRVAAVWEDGEYLQRLIEERGLEYCPSARHPFWHRIRTYEVVAQGH